MNIKVNPLLLPTVMNISIVPEPDKNESQHLIRRTKESSTNFVSEIDKTQICIFQRIIIQDIMDRCRSILTAIPFRLKILFLLFASTISSAH